MNCGYFVFSCCAQGLHRMLPRASTGHTSRALALVVNCFYSVPDGWPRSVCQWWWRDVSASRDAPAWHAFDEPLPGVTCTSASSVPVCSGLFPVVINYDEAVCTRFGLVFFGILDILYKCRAMGHQGQLTSHIWWSHKFFEKSLYIIIKYI